MRTLGVRVLLVAGLAVAGLVGCAEQEAVTPPGGSATLTPSETPNSTEAPGKPPVSTPTPPPVTKSGTGVVVPDGVTRVPADQVDASAIPDYWNYRGQVWVYEDGYSLEAFAMAKDGCSGAEAVVVDQKAGAVRIMLRPLPQPQGGRPDGRGCTMALVPRPVTVRLDAPLGDRMIYLTTGR